MTTADDTRLADLEARIARLEGREGIVETLYGYAHANDYLVAEEFADCFTDDAVWERRGLGAEGEAPLRGRAAFVHFIEQRKARQQVVTKHFVVDPAVSVDGDQATAESYFGLIDQTAEGEPYVRTFGRYRDRLTKDKDGRWRIAQRITEREGRSQR